MRKVFVIVIIFLLLSSCIIKVNDNNENYKDITNLKMSFDDKIENVIETVTDYKKYFSFNGTSVEEELQKMIYNYQKKLNDTANKSNKEKIQKIDTMINTLNEMLESFEKYQDLEKDLSKDISRKSTPIDFDISANLGTAALHVAVVAYFSANNCVLAAELLTHMRDNNVYDSIYRPINSNVFAQTNLFIEIANSPNMKGSANFENHNNIAENDMYYAVNKFDYSKSNKNDLIVLTDRYDFENSYNYTDFLTQTAINFMYLAQEDGFLTPFYTIIELNNSINTNNDNNIIPISLSNWRYNEFQVTLNQGDTITYSIVFETTGYRNIQTFGYNDSCLRLEYDDGTLITYDNDSGYDKNALLLWNFIAGVEYHIIVMMNNEQDLGNIRIGITPSFITSYETITPIKKTLVFFEYSYQDIEINNAENQVSIFTLRPLYFKNFILQTLKKNYYTDTFLYFIDPRRADVNIDDTNNYIYDNEKYFSCIKDDDSGGNTQAKINLVRQNINVSYMIISSHYSSSIVEPYYLNITGLN